MTFNLAPYYQKTDPSLYTGRKDSLERERFFQIIECLDLNHTGVNALSSNDKVLLGFRSDAGVKRNLGRIGAAEGPIAFRNQLGGLPCHTLDKLFDVGDIVCPKDELEKAQRSLAKLIKRLQQKGCKTIVIGGGHEIAWGHFLGLEKNHSTLGVINFDAHFDLRNDSGGASSGTPFLQIAKHLGTKSQAFHYSCLGIQPTANTQSLFKTAQQYNVSFLTAEQMYSLPLEAQYAFIDNFCQKVDTIYLTLCLDVFAKAYAPGVSAPQVLGLTPWQVIPLIKYIIDKDKVISIDIAELAPNYDIEGQTARLAATLMVEFLNDWQ